MAGKSEQKKNTGGDKLQKIVSLAKRRGFAYLSSEIYGGLGNVYDYGPLGTELLRNLRNLWWKEFVERRHDTVGMESQIFMHPNVWKASGHVTGFSDPLVEDVKTKKRYRADHVIEDWCNENDKKVPDTDNFSIKQLGEFITKNRIKSQDGNELSGAKNFNLMFKTKLGSVEDDADDLYLRAETAQGMYVDFNNIMDSTRLKVPFGIAQQGKAFRNEITKGKFIFRTLEFEQMEIQYFVQESDWKKYWEEWKSSLESWYKVSLDIPSKKLKWKPHSKLIFYAKKAEDVVYKFPWGFDEVSGLHYRTDYDLSTHTKHSGTDHSYTDTKTGKKFIPHVVESTWGLNRNLLMLLDNSYTEENGRVYLKLPPRLAPYKAAVFPLLGNKPELIEKAKKVFDKLRLSFHSTWDDRGNIGKRYAAQDEIGTPYCITIDFDTLKDNAVTIRDRDTTKQERVDIDKLADWLEGKLV